MLARDEIAQRDSAFAAHELILLYSSNDKYGEKDDGLLRDFVSAENKYLEADTLWLRSCSSMMLLAIVLNRQDTGSEQEALSVAADLGEG